MPTKEPYPSDLTDAEWKLLEPLLPGPKKLGRPARDSRRLVLNAIFYVVRSGCAWRLLPHDLPSWRLSYSYFTKWREDGLWARLNAHLRGAVRRRRGKKSPQRCDRKTRRALKWLTTPGSVATMRAGRSAGEPSGARQTAAGCPQGRGGSRDQHGIWWWTPKA